MRPFLFSAWAVSLCVSIAGAQQASRVLPAQFAGTERASRVEVRPPGIRLGLRKPREFSLAPLSEPEVAQLAEPGSRLKVGIHRNLPPDAVSTGSWETLPNGTRVWRMALRSPGSRGIRVEFRNFDVGNGNVWLHDGSSVVGPYTGRGTFDNGNFWSATLFAESATLEYEPEAGAAAQMAPPFEIRTISHRARTSTLGAATPDPADYCELDANCYSEWKGTMSTVGQITFEDGGDSFLCSGSLVATRDNSFKPYFLTAGHCINNEAAARTLEAYWTYQTAACGATPPASRETSAKSSVGAHLISSAGPSLGDYSLVLLKDVPAGVTFAGWDMGDPAAGTPLTGIHHPSGSWKRISFGTRSADQTVRVENSIAPGNLFLQVKWDTGRVEHGSSGSPLFSAPGVIVGSLSYGPIAPDGSVCSISPSIAGYSRFSNTYQQVKDYLEILPAASVTPDQAGVSFTVANHVPSQGKSVKLNTQSTGQIAYKLRADAPWIKLSATTGTISANAPSQVAISVDPDQLDQPGQYSSTVTILSGAAAPLFINVTASVKMDQSNVVASVSPNPVSISNGLFSFQIRLTETGGAPTHVTQVKINGTDYSSSIGNWFGTDQIAANGSIVAPLQGAGMFPAGDQFFEFWGIDEATGQHWYRVASVKFE